MSVPTTQRIDVPETLPVTMHFKRGYVTLNYQGYNTTMHIARAGNYRVESHFNHGRQRLVVLRA